MLHRTPSFRDICEKFKHSLRSLTARNTFSARLILRKVHKEARNLYHAALIIHNNQATGSDHGSYFFQRVKIQLHIQMIFRRTDTETSAGRSTDLNRFKISAFDATADVKNYLSQRRTHRHFDQSGIVYVSGKSKRLRTMVVFRSKSLIPFCAI